MPPEARSREDPQHDAFIAGISGAYRWYLEWNADRWFLDEGGIQQLLQQADPPVDQGAA